MSFPSFSGSHESAKKSIYCATVQPGLHSAQDRGDNSNDGCEDGQDYDSAPLITGSHESAKKHFFAQLCNLACVNKNSQLEIEDASRILLH